MKRTWWKESVAYQIYPRSFMDSNGDGIGDLQGVISKLDYLNQLGVDVIWICPIYDSPNDDNGYDIRNYYDIMREFGTMADFEELLAQAHERGLKIIMDLVVNHTSDEHPWFIESRQSPESEKRDYYIWQDGEKGQLPNNWESFFSGPVWEWDEASQSHYLHLFSRKQPDLNWENPKVVEEIHAMVKWWLDKGIDGFRVDAINHIGKAKGYPNAPNPDKLDVVPAHYYFLNLPLVHDKLREMNENVFSHYDIMTVGEAPGTSPREALLYVEEARKELDMVFHFEHMNMDHPGGSQGKWGLKPFPLTRLKQVMTRWQEELHGKGWNANYLSNHDQPRQVSRFGDEGEYRTKSAKMLATFIHTLEGTPFIYQGEEIGMTNVKFDSIAAYRDVEIRNYHQAQRKRGKSEADILKAVWVKGRDNARTPMQWDDSAQAGFTTGEPWIAVNDNYRAINVEQALQDPSSVFYYYQKLIALRKQSDAWVYGRYELLLEEHPDIYAYTRTSAEEKLLIILNFSAREVSLQLPDGLVKASPELLITNADEAEAAKQADLSARMLEPYEAAVYRI
ncbi:glycoside hydrolase family 13 protein [Marinicrinis sediminis]|uniref:oligo-1,6-glucosidase n=1 Tax=Marinicrinis sediminis TaxID=1652465 RepID=A0ABW5R808_9BACL